MSASQAGPSKLLAAQTTTELYRSCMNLSEEARSLLVENEGLKRLGLNAQVLAAQTGDQGGALEVVVSEIGRLSLSIRRILSELGEAARDLSRTSIGLLHLSHLHTSYDGGRRVGIAPSSQANYLAVVERVQARRGSHLSDLEERLRTVTALVDDLGRVAQQIPPVTTMIRIVVTEVRIRSVELLGTVDDLKTFHAHLDEKVERMASIRGTGFRYIQALHREN